MPSTELQLNCMHFHGNLPTVTSDSCIALCHWVRSVAGDLFETMHLVALCGHWAREQLSRDAERLFEILDAI
jgi:hypothetical protein